MGVTSVRQVILAEPRLNYDDFAENFPYGSLEDIKNASSAALPKSKRAAHRARLTEPRPWLRVGRLIGLSLHIVMESTTIRR